MAFFHQWMVIIITRFVCVQCITSPSNKLGNVMWKITSSPIEFGKTAELTCLITNTKNDCTHELRQWIGGQQYTSICQNMRCSDGSKYHAKLETPCLYTLIISNFSMYDVNCDYVCVYGLRSYRKHLQLNSKEFVSIPRVIHTNVSMIVGFLDIKVYMEDVYPSPKCHALLVGMDITKQLFIVSLLKGLFYHVELDLHHYTDACSGNITIYCYLGNNEVTALNEYIGDCKDIKTAPSRSFGGQITITGVSAAIVCIAVILWIRILRIKRKRQRHYDSEVDLEMDPLIDTAVQMEVYRLLRADENPANGLFAKAPDHTSSVVLHVAYGSYNQSRFISACGSLEYAINFRAKNKQNGFPNGPIVKINIDAGMTFYDLRTSGQRQQILVSKNMNLPQETIYRFHSFAEAFQEVLIVDYVPAGKIVVLNV